MSTNKWLSSFVLFAVALFTLWAFSTASSAPRKVDCYEQFPDADGLRDTKLVIRAGDIYVCGVRERVALPTVIQCYELKRGCTR